MTKSKGEYGYVTLAVSSRVYSNFVAISQGNVSVNNNMYVCNLLFNYAVLCCSKRRQ